MSDLPGGDFDPAGVGRLGRDWGGKRLALGPALVRRQGEERIVNP